MIRSFCPGFGSGSSRWGGGAPIYDWKQLTWDAARKIFASAPISVSLFTHVKERIRRRPGLRNDADKPGIKPKPRAIVAYYDT